MTCYRASSSVCRTCSVKDCVGNVCHLSARRQWVAGHALKHLGGSDDLDGQAAEAAAQTAAAVAGG
jgi:hypothetical protein